MPTIKERQLQILDETVAYYSKDTNRRCTSPKGTVTGGCFYAPESVNKVGISDGCAVGRLLTPEFRIFIDSKIEPGFNSYIDNENIFSLLPNDIKELGGSYLRALQGLHDSPLHWLENGISTNGLEYVEKMKIDYQLI